MSEMESRDTQYDELLAFLRGNSVDKAVHLIQDYIASSNAQAVRSALERVKARLSEQLVAQGSNFNPVELVIDAELAPLEAGQEERG